MPYCETDLQGAKMVLNIIFKIKTGNLVLKSKSKVVSNIIFKDKDWETKVRSGNFILNLKF